MTDERNPDLTQALLLELRTQLEEARQTSEYLHARWTETAARADELEEQLAEAASYANAIGRIESVLGMAGAGPLRETVRAVDDVVKQLADARLSAEQGVKVAEALAAEKSALLSRVVVLEAALRGLLREEPNIYEGRLEASLYVSVDALEDARAALEVDP
jgi:hypothetical protein